MSELLHEDNEAFRRALHAAAEQVEPADNGLERIKARVSHRRPMPWPLAFVDVALTRLSLRVPDGVWSVWDKVALQFQAALDRFLPASARAMSGRLRLGWVRPVAAMSVAVFIVAAVVSMAIEVPQYVSPQAATGLQSGGSGGGARVGGSSGAPGQSQANSGSRSSSGSSNQTSGAPNRTGCKSTPPTINPEPSTASPSSSSPTSPSSSSPTSPSPSSSPSPSTSDAGSTAPSGVGNSPETGSGDTTPSTGAGSDAAGDQPAVKSADDAASHAKPIHTTRKAAASDAATPCSSPKKSAKPTSSVKVSPDTAGGVLFLWAGSAGLAAAEVSARV
jgi:hypothetical protein